MNDACLRFFKAIPAKMREEDKRKHMVWSFWLTLAALCFLTSVEAFVLVFLIGLSKECWDRFYGSGFCLFDMVGNLLGSFVALTLGLLVSGLFLPG